MHISLKIARCQFSLAFGMQLQVYQAVYKKSLRDEIAAKCDEGKGWFQSRAQQGSHTPVFRK